MKKYIVYQVDAFTTQKFTGNPAGVVSNADGLTDAQMQSIARELNNSETAFIFAPTASDHDVRIRFFTPTTEVPSCGHATIAAHYARAMENRLPTCTVAQKIGIGILPVDIINLGNDYKVVMTQGNVEFTPPFTGQERDEIIEALGITDRDIDQRCPVQVVSTGHSKVLVGVRDRNVLNSLRPDTARLIEISGRIRCNGYHVFTFDADPGDILVHGRMFAPAIGILEDPVTGNANGPLGAYIVLHRLMETGGEVFTFSARQGETMGRAGTVDVEVVIKNGNPVQVRVGGRAVVAFRTEIEI